MTHLNDRQGSLLQESSERILPRHLLSPSNPYYRVKIRIFNEWNSGEIITAERIAEFCTQLKEEIIRQQNGESYTNASVNVFLAAMKSAVELTFSEFGTSEGKERLDSFFRKEMKYLPVEKTVDDSKIFSADELRMLSDHADQKTWLLIKFLYQTGMRISEALDVRINDICIIEEEAVVRVRRGKRDKERKIELVPVSLIKLIESEFCSAEYLFQNRHHRSRLGKYTRQHWGKILSDLSHKVLGRNLAPHFLRHSHATALADKGVSFGAIQKRLGHKRASTTLEIYDRSKVRKDQLDEIMKGID